MNLNSRNTLLAATIFGLLSLMYACAGPSASEQQATATEEKQTAPAANGMAAYPDKVQTIALGSCNDQDDPQTMWAHILQNKPDLWIWLGDNIYADTEDMDEMWQMYQQQKTSPQYARFISQVPVVGIWDDHDYGVNDGGKNYPEKAASRDLMLKFLDVPKDKPVWQREGGYQSWTFGQGDKKVKVLLLDARYFRDELKKAPTGSKNRYQVSEEGDFLGQAQWQWLQQELQNSDARLHLIGCGIQMIPEDHGWEKWANFPQARQRLFKTIANSGAEGVIMLSGDRHIAELSRYQPAGMGYPVYELTSSGLTHTWSEAWEENNRHRVGELIIKKNFGVMNIDWQAEPMAVTFEVRGEGNELYLQEKAVYPAM